MDEDLISMNGDEEEDEMGFNDGLNYSSVMDVANDEEDIKPTSLTSTLPSSSKKLPGKKGPRKIFNPKEIWLDLLDKLRKKDKIGYFHAKVNKIIAPDYHLIIKKPMYFNKMERKITKGKYRYFDDFVKDIALIKNNAIRYNGINSTIGKSSLALEKHLERIVKWSQSKWDMVAEEAVKAGETMDDKVLQSLNLSAFPDKKDEAEGFDGSSDSDLSVIDIKNQRTMGGGICADEDTAYSAPTFNNNASYLSIEEPPENEFDVLSKLPPFEKNALKKVSLPYVPLHVVRSLERNKKRKRKAEGTEENDFPEDAPIFCPPLAFDVVTKSDVYNARSTPIDMNAFLEENAAVMKPLAPVPFTLTATKDPHLLISLNQRPENLLASRMRFITGSNEETPKESHISLIKNIAPNYLSTIWKTPTGPFFDSRLLGFDAAPEFAPINANLRVQGNSKSGTSDENVNQALTLEQDYPTVRLNALRQLL